MTDLRLASIDGERTIEVGAIGDVLTDAREFVTLMEGAAVRPDTVLAIAVINGRLRFDIWGRGPTVAEGIGLLELAKSNLIHGARE